MNEKIYTYINPLTDFGFKYIFGREADKEFNEREKKAYRESLKVYRDNYAIAETERTEGRAEGRAEGILEGEAMACRKVAKNMMKMGMDIETISDATGLSIQEIRNLN